MRWFESSHPSHWFESSHPSIAWRARRLKTLTRGGYALRLGFLLAVFAVSCTVSRNASGLPPLESSTGWRTAEPRFEREQLWGPPGANRWEPTIAADPESSWVYQLTTGQRPNYLLFRASSDGGRTWGAARHLCHRGVRVPFRIRSADRRCEGRRHRRRLSRRIPARRGLRAIARSGRNLE